MADYIVKDTELTQIADAIRAKGSTSASLVFPSGFASAINSISTGDGALVNINVNITGTSNLAISDIANGTIQTFTDSELTFVRAGLFMSCSSLSAVVMSACTSVGYAAFSGCTKLSVVSMPLCQSINADAFYNCLSLAAVNFPQCTSVATAAFLYCTQLSAVALPACKSVSARAFENCIKLPNISLPLCSSIEYNAFAYCTGLSTFTYPSNMSGAGYLIFNGCTSLRSIYIPHSYVVKLLYSATAYGCPFYATPIVQSSYLGTYGSIFVPASLVNAYRTSTNWITLKDRITAIPE